MATLRQNPDRRNTAEDWPAWVDRWCWEPNDADDARTEALEAVAPDVIDWDALFAERACEGSIFGHAAQETW